MSWWKFNETPIPRPDLIGWDNRKHGWSESTFGPIESEPVVSMEEARAHFAPIVAEAKKAAAPRLIDPWRGRWKGSV